MKWNESNEMNQMKGIKWKELNELNEWTKNDQSILNRWTHLILKMILQIASIR